MWLADGNSLIDGIFDLRGADIVFTISRVIHGGAVVFAMVWMSRPDALAWFRR